MARTTLALVSGIIEVDASIVADEAAFAPFASIANELVTEACTGDNGPDTDYTDARLILVETWLAAHFYTNRDPRVTQEKASSVSQSVQSKVDLGLATSHYGQTAMRLDTNGGLAKLNAQTKKGGKPTVGVAWLGTEFEDIPIT